MSAATQAHRSRRTNRYLTVARLLTAKMIPNNLRRTLVVVSSVLVASCADSPTAPEAPIDAVAAARLMPSVTDARIRIANGIENPSVRERVVHDLTELETALANGDGRKSRFHVRLIASVIEKYGALDAGKRNAPDLVAIALMLYQVSQLVDAGFDIASAS